VQLPRSCDRKLATTNLYRPASNVPPVDAGPTEANLNSRIVVGPEAASRASMSPVAEHHKRGKLRKRRSIGA
jgi:hypothetical protein